MGKKCDINKKNCKKYILCFPFHYTVTIVFRENSNFLLSFDNNLNCLLFLEWQSCHYSAETLFLTKISYNRNVSLAVYLPIFYFSFCQKTNLHLYKWSRLLSYLNTHVLFSLHILVFFIGDGMGRSILQHDRCMLC